MEEKFSVHPTSFLAKTQRAACCESSRGCLKPLIRLIEVYHWQIPKLMTKTIVKKYLRGVVYLIVINVGK